MNKLNALMRGVMVFIILAVLTVIEYFLGIAEVHQVFMWLIALMKAVLVLWYFMHLPRVFKSESEGGHE